MGKLLLTQSGLVCSKFTYSFSEIFLNHISVPPVKHYKGKRNIKQRIISNKTDIYGWFHNAIFMIKRKWKMENMTKND